MACVVQWAPTSACTKYGLDEFQFRGGPFWAGVNRKRSGKLFRDADLARGPGNSQVCALPT